MGDMSREPSMEDILSSIRRVIARDEAPGARAQRAAAPSEDILDLNEEEDDAVAESTLDDSGAATAQEELVSVASADAARQSLEALTAAMAPAAAAAAATVPAGDAASRMSSSMRCGRCSSNGSTPICRRWSN